MTEVQTKETIRQEFVERQAAREAARLVKRQTETETAIATTEVETRMPIEEGLTFLRAGGEREDAV